MNKVKVLIVGCGSIGERHLRCFLKTGRTIVGACDLQSEVLQRICKQYAVTGFPKLTAALDAERWDAAVICTHAGVHVDQAMQCLGRGLHVLVEKPLSTDLKGTAGLQQAIEASGRVVAVGYVLRFLPALQAARAHLQSGQLGRPLHVAVTAGQHFPAFRPTYREVYYAQHETGGGAIQDAITHNVNAVEWLVGPATRVFCEAAHQALPGVSVEDTVCVSARHGDVLASYALNQFQWPNEATYQLHCAQGSLKIEVHEQRWAVWPAGASGWQFHSAPMPERDTMFIHQAEAFLDAMQGSDVTKLCTVPEALQTLKFNLAALHSWRHGVPVDIT